VQDIPARRPGAAGGREPASRRKMGLGREVSFGATVTGEVSPLLEEGAAQPAHARPGAGCDQPVRAPEWGVHGDDERPGTGGHCHLCEDHGQPGRIPPEDEPERVH